MKAILLIEAVLLILCGLFPLDSLGQSIQDSHGDPSALEQYMLELINRARVDPTQEGVILDTLNTDSTRDMRKRKPQFFTSLRDEFAHYPAVSPLAFNPQLIASARAHTHDMIARHYFSHVSLEGLSPSQRVAVAGYTEGIGENLDGGGAATAVDVLDSHFGLMVDADNAAQATSPFGHRLNILSGQYLEIGLGIEGNRSNGKVTQDFGLADRHYILGVAFRDSNGNSFYDPGEGVANITVKPDIGNHFAVTSTSGGYAIVLDPVETVSKEQSIPIAVGSTTFAEAKPYDDAFRQKEIQKTPDVDVHLTWSGGALSAPVTTTVRIKRAVRINYKLTGTDGAFYMLSLLTVNSVKADLIINKDGTGTSKDKTGNDGGGETTTIPSAIQAVFGPLKAEAPAGWVQSSWLGKFNQSNYPTIEHETLGSMQVSGKDPGDLYFKIIRLGWVYTNQVIFPQIYSYSQRSWLKYKVGSKNPFQFYSLKKKKTLKF